MKRFLFSVFLLVCNFVFSQSFTDLIDGISKHERGDYKGAMEDYSIHLRSNPNDYYGYYNRGIIKFMLYGADSALVDLERASSLGFQPSTDLLNNYKKYGILITNDDLSEIFNLKGIVNKDILQREYTHNDTLRGALRAERTCYDVTFYNLSLKIDSTGRIEGENDITFNVLTSSNRIQIDLIKQMRIKKIIHNNTKLSYEREGNAVFVTFPTTLLPNTTAKISILYSGFPKEAKNPPWEGGFVRTVDKSNNVWIGVACEGEGASTWWPCKDHLSDEPDSMQISLLVPKKYKAISNGNLISEKKTIETAEYIWKISNPINNYNVTFYMGNYCNFQDTMACATGKKILDYYVLPYNLEKAKAHFQQTKQVLKFYEEAFGEYAFWNDGFGMLESPYAGMEHQGAIAYGSDYGENNNIKYRTGKYDYLIVHEAAHEWWGNSISVGDMADLWIHEGFATYSEFMFIENQYNHDEYLYEVVARRKHILNLFPIVGSRDVNDNAAVGGDIYSKGAQILHNLRCSINNDSLFFEILKSFAVKYRKSIVNTNDFIQHVNSITGKDYGSFFNTWLYKTQLPVLEYKQSQEGNNMVIKYRWASVEPGFEMPFGLLNDGKGQRLVATSEWKEELFYNVSGVDIPTGWNPVYINLPRNSFTYFVKKRLTD